MNATMSTGHGSTGEEVGATPSEKTSVRGHWTSIAACRLTHAGSRAGKGTESEPPSRRRSTFWKGSGDKHHGERCTSPERLLVCEGWCRIETPGKTTLDHPDVVRWTLNPSSIPSYYSLGSCRYPSRPPKMVKFLGMRSRATVTKSQ